MARIDSLPSLIIGVTKRPRTVIRSEPRDELRASRASDCHGVRRPVLLQKEIVTHHLGRLARRDAVAVQRRHADVAKAVDRRIAGERRCAAAAASTPSPRRRARCSAVPGGAIVVWPEDDTLHAARLDANGVVIVEHRAVDAGIVKQREEVVADRRQVTDDLFGTGSRSAAMLPSNRNNIT